MGYDDTHGQIAPSLANSDQVPPVHTYKTTSSGSVKGTVPFSASSALVSVHQSRILPPQSSPNTLARSS